MGSKRPNKGPARDRYVSEGHQSLNKEKRAEKHLAQIEKWAKRALDPVVIAKHEAKVMQKKIKRLTRKGIREQDIV